MSDRSITVTEASRNFSDLINRTYYRGESTVLIRGGEEVAQVIPLEKKNIIAEEWLTIWDSIPHLERQDAEVFSEELTRSRGDLTYPISQWD